LIVVLLLATFRGDLSIRLKDPTYSGVRGGSQVSADTIKEFTADIDWCLKAFSPYLASILGIIVRRPRGVFAHTTSQHITMIIA
jgi:hypothetical protein